MSTQVKYHRPVRTTHVPNLRIRLGGEFRTLTESNVFALVMVIRNLVEERGASQLTLNCHDVDFLSAAALGAFVRLHKELGARGGRLILRGVKEPLYEMFAVTRLIDLFEVRRGARRAFDGCTSLTGP
jgi:anti-sigma B factor antagonist